jgi:hypothetical protein
MAKPQPKVVEIDAALLSAGPRTMAQREAGAPPPLRIWRARLADRQHRTTLTRPTARGSQ